MQSRLGASGDRVPEKCVVSKAEPGSRAKSTLSREHSPALKDSIASVKS